LGYCVIDHEFNSDVILNEVKNLDR
jgi:hypothetical protein